MDALIDRLPLFVRAGSIVPLGEPILSTNLASLVKREDMSSRTVRLLGCAFFGRPIIARGKSVRANLARVEPRSGWLGVGYQLRPAGATWAPRCATAAYPVGPGDLEVSHFKRFLRQLSFTRFASMPVGTGSASFRRHHAPGSRSVRWPSVRSSQ